MSTQIKVFKHSLNLSTFLLLFKGHVIVWVNCTNIYTNFTQMKVTDELGGGAHEFWNYCNTVNFIANHHYAVEGFHEIYGFGSLPRCLITEYRGQFTYITVSPHKNLSNIEYRNIVRPLKCLMLPFENVRNQSEIRDMLGNKMF